jgi:hypothetical protein
VSTWNYTAQDGSIRHMGPMAQDFRAAFGLGEDDTTISVVDEQGVALAAIQGLYGVVQRRSARIATQESDVVVLNAGPGRARPHCCQYCCWPGDSRCWASGWAVASAAGCA